MIANVIPSIRTPRGITGFDYEIPEGMDIQVGDLVRIPFRKRELIGLVAKIQQTSEIKTPLKPISGSFHDLRLGEQSVQLLSQLSERSFTSQASVLHAWLGVLPKKKEVRSEKREARKEKQESTHFSRPSPLAPCPLFLPDHLNHPRGILAKVKEALEQQKQVLILSPWSARAEQIAKRFDTHALTSDIANGKRFKLWSTFAKKESPLLVTTRIGAWCGTSADLIIIDEPENDDHKQDELSPRYDARWLAAYLQSKGTQLELIGRTPRLVQIANKDIASEKEIPNISAKIIYVDTHHADWSDLPSIQGRALLALEEAIREQRRGFIIHPIHGDQARLRCKDCGWSAACEACGSAVMVEKQTLYCKRCNHRAPLIIECPSCGGTQFAFSKPGRLRLNEAIEKQHLLNTEVVSIGEWNSIPTIPENSIVLLTDLSLLAGAREDLRKTEQTIIAWRRLVDTCAITQSTLIVQGDPATLNQAKDWLDGTLCFQAFEKELKERKTFQLPPTARLTKLIFRGNQVHAERILGILRDNSKTIPDISISGPFAVQFRPSHREARWIGHITAPLSTPLQTIIRLLAPIAEQTDTLIDLDPIAFFE